MADTGQNDASVLFGNPSLSAPAAQPAGVSVSPSSEEDASLLFGKRDVGKDSSALGTTPVSFTPHKSEDSNILFGSSSLSELHQPTPPTQIQAVDSTSAPDDPWYKKAWDFANNPLFDEKSAKNWFGWDVEHWSGWGRGLFDLASGLTSPLSVALAIGTFGTSALESLGIKAAITGGEAALRGTMGAEDIAQVVKGSGVLTKAIKMGANVDTAYAAMPSFGIDPQIVAQGLETLAKQGMKPESLLADGLIRKTGGSMLRAAGMDIAQADKIANWTQFAIDGGFTAQNAYAAAIAAPRVLDAIKEGDYETAKRLAVDAIGSGAFAFLGGRAAHQHAGELMTETEAALGLRVKPSDENLKLIKLLEPIERERIIAGEREKQWEESTRGDFEDTESALAEPTQPKSHQPDGRSDDQGSPHESKPIQTVDDIRNDERFQRIQEIKLRAQQLIRKGLSDKDTSAIDEGMRLRNATDHIHQLPETEFAKGGDHSKRFDKALREAEGQPSQEKSPSSSESRVSPKRRFSLRKDSDWVAGGSSESDLRARFYRESEGRESRDNMAAWHDAIAEAADRPEEKIVKEETAVTSGAKAQADTDFYSRAKAEWVQKNPQGDPASMKAISEIAGRAQELKASVVSRDNGFPPDIQEWIDSKKLKDKPKEYVDQLLKASDPRLLTEKEIEYSKHVGDHFDESGERAVGEEALTDLTDAYVTRVWKDPENDTIKKFRSVGRSSGDMSVNTAMARKRVFQSTLEGILRGSELSDHDMVALAAHNGNEFSSIVAHRQGLRRIRGANARASDGRPMAALSGSGHVIESTNAEGETVNPATVINPKAMQSIRMADKVVGGLKNQIHRPEAELTKPVAGQTRIYRPQGEQKWLSSRDEAHSAGDKVEYVDVPQAEADYYLKGTDRRTGARSLSLDDQIGFKNRFSELRQEIAEVASSPLSENLQRLHDHPGRGLTSHNEMAKKSFLESLRSAVAKAADADSPTGKFRIDSVDGAINDFYAGKTDLANRAAETALTELHSLEVDANLSVAERRLSELQQIVKDKQQGLSPKPLETRPAVTQLDQLIKEGRVVKFGVDRRGRELYGWTTHDYKTVDNPNFRGWKVPTVDTDGNPIYVQGELKVHPEAHEYLQRRFGADQSIVKKVPGLKTVLAAAREAKGLLLFVSPFHVIQEGLRAIMTGISPIGLPKFDSTNPMHVLAAEKGVWEFKDYKGVRAFEDGLTGHSKVLAKVPLLRELQAGLQTFLFDRYIPALKLRAFESLYSRYNETYGKVWTKEKIATKTANDVNNRFGGLDYKRMGRSAGTMDVSRIMALAPDWLESEVRFMGSMFGDEGKIVRRDVARMAVIMWGAARVLNYLVSGKPHNEAPLGVAWTDDEGREKIYSLRSMPGDILHAVSDPVNFINGRVAPLGRVAAETFLGRDEYGRKLTRNGIFVNLLRNVSPIPIQSAIKAATGESPDINPADSAVKAAGFTVYNYRTQGQKLAAQLASSHTETGEVDKTKLRRYQGMIELENRLRLGKVPVTDLYKAVEEGQIHPDEARKMLKTVKETEGLDPDSARFYAHVSRLPIQDILQIWDNSSAEEHALIAKIFVRKATNYFKKVAKEMSPAERQSDPVYNRLRKMLPQATPF